MSQITATNAGRQFRIFNAKISDLTKQIDELTTREKKEQLSRIEQAAMLTRQTPDKHDLDTYVHIMTDIGLSNDPMGHVLISYMAIIVVLNSIIASTREYDPQLTKQLRAARKLYKKNRSELNKRAEALNLYAEIDAILAENPSEAWMH